MKRMAEIGLAIGFLVVFALLVNAQMKEMPAKTTLKPPSTTVRAVHCPDSYDLVASVTSVRTGLDERGPYIVVTGAVKNTGGKDFTSARTDVRIYVREYGNSEGNEVSRTGIARLNKGQSLSVSGKYYVNQPAGFEWCQWGCVPLRGGICKYLIPTVFVTYGVASEKAADCAPSNDRSLDRPEFNIHFVRRCSE